MGVGLIVHPYQLALHLVPRSFSEVGSSQSDGWVARYRPPKRQQNSVREEGICVYVYERVGAMIAAVPPYSYTYCGNSSSENIRHFE